MEEIKFIKTVIDGHTIISVYDPVFDSSAANEFISLKSYIRKYKNDNNKSIISKYRNWRNGKNM